MFLAAAIMLPGCNLLDDPTTPEAASTATSLLEPISSPSSTSVPTESPTPTNTVTPLPSVTPTPTVTDTPVADVVIDDRQVLACSAALMNLNFVDSFGIQLLTRMDFTTEANLEVEGWKSRPRNLNSTPAQSATIDGNNLPSTSVTLVTGEFDLIDGEAIFLEGSKNDQLLLNPCSDECSFEILDRSPDDQWQLVQIPVKPGNEEGVWLISSSEKVQLVDRVPFWVKWQWSDDASMLWFMYPEYEYGLNASIVNLEQPPIIRKTPKSDESPFLSVTDYFVAFSSQDKSLTTTRNTHKPTATDRENLYIFDIKQSILEPITFDTIPGIKRVQWNEATESVVVISFQQDSIKIKERDGDIVLQLPLSIFLEAFVRSSLKEELNDSVYGKLVTDRIATSLYAFSTTGQHLAISSEDGNISIFECQVDTEG